MTAFVALFLGEPPVVGGMFADLSVQRPVNNIGCEEEYQIDCVETG